MFYDSFSCLEQLIALCFPGGLGSGDNFLIFHLFNFMSLSLAFQTGRAIVQTLTLLGTLNLNSSQLSCRPPCLLCTCGYRPIFLSPLSLSLIYLFV